MIKGIHWIYSIAKILVGIKLDLSNQELGDPVLTVCHCVMTQDSFPRPWLLQLKNEAPNVSFIIKKIHQLELLTCDKQIHVQQNYSELRSNVRAI